MAKTRRQKQQEQLAASRAGPRPAAPVASASVDRKKVKKPVLGDSTHRINRKPSSRNDGVSEKINVESSDVRQSHGGFVENNLPSLGTNLPLKLPPRPPRRQKRTNKTKNVTSPVEGVQSPTASSSDGQMKRGNSTISALIRSPRKRSKKSTSNPPHVEVNENHGLVMSPFHPSRMTRTIAEHDAVNENNILEVHQYATDIYQRLYETESRYQISCWTGRQPWMSQELRYKTVDWMCRMHGRLKLQPETLYLGVQLFDRFCSKVAVHENNLFLISSTALFIAWKYEETEAPTVKAFKFSKDEVVAMERKMLEILEFRISAPTGHAFLRRFLFICNASRLTSYTASYYLERCLPVEDALRVRPSLMAAAAVCLALGHPFLEQTYNPEQMTKRLEDYTGFSRKELKVASRLIVAEFETAPVLAFNDIEYANTVYRKYSKDRFGSVAQMALPNMSYLSFQYDA